MLCVGFSLRYYSNNQGNVYSAADVVGVVCAAVVCVLFIEPVDTVPTFNYATDAGIYDYLGNARYGTVDDRCR